MINPAKICGRIKFVSGLADAKIRFVDSAYADLRVQCVSAEKANSLFSFKWAIVECFPDYTVEIVSSDEDFTVAFVDGAGGLRGS